VIGGGNVALRKVKTLLEYGANITVVAPKLHPELKEMSGLVLREREFEKSDLDGMRLVFAASSDGDCNRRVAGLCRERGILVNVADLPGECDFYFPALVRRADLVVGISTGGKSPAVAKKIREEFDRALPESLADFLEEMWELRTVILERGEPIQEDREYCDKLHNYFEQNFFGAFKCRKTGSADEND
ncbi:MAG: bifunctional precorrin-2 dehydrogenase/sirohydrochlorin ferrochelatase, partial [Lachnospiraceae bacterium]|nr:bifunctional precorrin-2 dehydrogenase/sirohydrochlorin ferrochelatase [Lachnospiraceae bacterium]